MNKYLLNIHTNFRFVHYTGAVPERRARVYPGADNSYALHEAKGDISDRPPNRRERLRDLSAVILYPGRASGASRRSPNCRPQCTPTL